MAKPDLFKDLPRPRETEPPIDPENITEDPNEFPLGEYEKDPLVIEELPPQPAPPEEGTTPPPEVSPPEVITDPDIEVEPEVSDPDDNLNEEDGTGDPDQYVSASAAAGHMTEMEMLRNRARLMGISFSNNIGLESLKTKIYARIEGEKGKEAAENLRNGTPSSEVSSGVSSGTGVPVKTERQQMYDEEMRLVRLRITNLDPKKKDLPGEIFTVANRMVGAVKKFIPYGEATDNGYHVPYIIYRQLREREFLNIKTRKDRQGRTIVETGMAREFALEELPPLTQKELDRLAASQAAAAGMSG